MKGKLTVDQSLKASWNEIPPAFIDQLRGSMQPMVGRVIISSGPKFGHYCENQHLFRRGLLFLFSIYQETPKNWRGYALLLSTRKCSTLLWAAFLTGVYPSFTSTAHENGIFDMVVCIWTGGRECAIETTVKYVAPKIRWPIKLICNFSLKLISKRREMCNQYIYFLFDKSVAYGILFASDNNRLNDFAIPFAEFHFHSVGKLRC